MNISESDAVRIQGHLYLVTTDDTSTSAISMASGRDRFSDWTYAVNLIYRCLISGVWTTNAAPYMPSWLDYHGLKNDYDFCKKLSEYSPFVLDEINMRYWMEPLLCNTDFGQSFVESFGLENLENEVYPPFINALEKLFYEKGVPWDAGDFFNIKAKETLPPHQTGSV